jgi:dTDP-4-dehydrorhamnose 3,5-epimerase
MFNFEHLHLSGLTLIKPRAFSDNRGFFIESYKKSIFKENGIIEDFVQDNQSFSKKNVLRGLHFQTDPHAQGKLVRCISGEIQDVAVDIRRDSPTFLQWYSIVLSAENKAMLYVPAGFAHGFLTLSETAEILYKVTHEYVASADSGIIWNDPDISIEWICSEPILSEKDANLSMSREIL